MQRQLNRKRPEIFAQLATVAHGLIIIQFRALATMNKRRLLLCITLLGSAVWLWISSPHSEELAQDPHKLFESPQSVSSSLTLPHAELSKTNRNVVKQNQDLISLTEKSDDAYIGTSPSSQTLEDTEQALLNAFERNRTTAIISTDNDKDGTGKNRKPELNQQIHQQLQTVIYSWQLTQGSPISYELNLNQLFSDPDDDFLTTRIDLRASGLSISNNSTLLIQGTPELQTEPSHLTVSVRDSYHGDDQQAWVSAHFALPDIEASIEEQEHPLVGDVVYRLESAKQHAGVSYNFEVVFCEAFKFINDVVYYAKSATRTSCPNENQLRDIGHYQINGNQLTISSSESSFHAQQVWDLKKEYSSVQQKGVTNYFTTIYADEKYESYTLQKSKAAMEAKINIHTGQYEYQSATFDYLILTPKQEYLLVYAGNYIYQRENMGSNGEFMDSDLNIHGYDISLNCQSIGPFFQSSVMAGKGNYDIDIVSSSTHPNNTYSFHCGEFPSNQHFSLFTDLTYSPYDEFIDGNIYSYIFRPKPEYAHLYEELKMNFIYQSPTRK